jgi:hypothetical protein
MRTTRKMNPPVRKRRTKTELEEDLDDEIPSNAGRRGRKPSRDEDEDEDEEEEVKPRRKAKAKEEEEDETTIDLLRTAATVFVNG